MKDYAYGINSVLNVLKGSRKVFQLLYSKEIKQIIDAANKKNILLKKVSFEKLNELTKGKKHQGIVAEIEPFQYKILDEVIKNKSKNDYHFFIMLNQIEDPHNFGAIVRTAEAAGVDAIIISDKRQVHVNSTVLSVSTGATEFVPIIKVANLNGAIKKLKSSNFWIVTADMNGKNYNEIDFKMKTCLVIGSEGKGVSELVKKNSDILASLPMCGEISSLNASVSAAILIYKIKEQI